MCRFGTNVAFNFLCEPFAIDPQMLGKRGPTRLLHRIMKRHDRMFTVSHTFCFDADFFLVPENYGADNTNALSACSRTAIGQ